MTADQETRSVDPMLLPFHTHTMTLTHNDHKGHRLTVAEWIEMHGDDDLDWISGEQKRKAITADDFWMIQWLPEVRGTYRTMLAADLDPLLQAARAVNL